MVSAKFDLTETIPGVFVLPMGAGSGLLAVSMFLSNPIPG
jgi:hypothetical protein